MKAMKFFLIGGIGCSIVLSGCGKKLTTAEAKNMVLQDAGLSSDQVVFTSEKIDDDGFEFSFYTNGKAYTYEITDRGRIEEVKTSNYDAPIIPNTNSTNGGNQTTPNPSQDQNAPNQDKGTTDQKNETNVQNQNGGNQNKDANTQQQNQAPNASKQTQAPNVPQQNQGVAPALTQDQAVDKVVAHFGIDRNAITNLRAYRDYDDGFQVYDIEFYYNGREYSADVDVFNGNLTSIDIDSIYD